MLLVSKAMRLIDEIEEAMYQYLEDPSAKPSNLPAEIIVRIPEHAYEAVIREGSSTVLRVAGTRITLAPGRSATEPEVP